VIFDVIVFPLATSCYFVIWVTKMGDWTIPDSANLLRIEFIVHAQGCSGTFI